MKPTQAFIALAALTAVFASAPARADHYHSRVGVGVVIGSPGYWHYPGPYYYPPYPYPYYAYPPVVVAPAEPPTYIQQEPAPQQAQPSNDWFYCRKPEGYYPYVKQCPGGWQRVAPQPPQP
ncbi:MAG TPA: hypothetical protein VHL60_00835 [Oxalicibacterium sp.]|jgi:hypothetical protein|nr:hypothetical protein [Oxalicibacterium sp.]